MKEVEKVESQEILYEQVRNCFNLMKNCEDYQQVKTDLEQCLNKGEEEKDKNLYQHNFLEEWECCKVVL